MAPHAAQTIERRLSVEGLADAPVVGVVLFVVLFLFLCLNGVVVEWCWWIR